MEKTKKTIAQEMYNELDVITGGEFNFAEDEDLFVQAFEKVLYDYALIPVANIIDD